MPSITPHLPEPLAVYRIVFFDRVAKEVSNLDLVGAPGPIAALTVFAEWADMTYPEHSAGFLSMELIETTDEHRKAHRKSNGPELKVVK